MGPRLTRVGQTVNMGWYRKEQDAPTATLLTIPFGGGVTEGRK